MKLVICGAGPVGALAALYAAKRGDEVHVYDMRKDPRKPRSSEPIAAAKTINLALSERGINSIRRADAGTLLDDILNGTIPMHSRMIHGKDKKGDLVQESQRYDTMGRSMKAADRAQLGCHLLAALGQYPNVSLHFEEKLLKADFHGMTARFKSCRDDDRSNSMQETETNFDFFIGADGAHSMTRQQLMKYTCVDYHQMFIDVLWCEFQMKPLANGEYKLSPHHLHVWPAGSFMFIAIPSLGGSFTCTLFASSSHFGRIAKDPESSLPAFFDEHFPGVTPDLISQVDLIAQFKRNPHLPLISIKCSPYHFSGSVVILGDAAHAMVPFYGQGMNSGLEDVRILFDHFDNHGIHTIDGQPEDLRKRLQEALDAYSAFRKPDAHAINDLALKNYREMTSDVTSLVYKTRKQVEELVSTWLPWTRWRTQATRVSFENQRFSEVVRDVEAQGRTLASIFGIGSCALLAVGLWTALKCRVRR